MTATLTCPKCQRSMERGFSSDIGYGTVVQSSWTAGEPRKRWLFGGIQWKQKDNLPIAIYRCTGCGYLESYAAAK